jgi:Zn-dependent protease
MMSDDIFIKISVWTLPLLLAITLHEAAHGWVAWKLGDSTAKNLGRVSFNPLVHIDPFGTVILPLLLLVSGTPFMFGYAKPVPVNFNQLNNPRMDMVWVALAGPMANILLLLVSAMLFHVVPVIPDVADKWFANNLGNMILINAILAVFNMLPIPPLDGGRVAVGLLPDFLARPLSRLERYGMLIIIMLIFLIPMVGRELGMDLNILWYIMMPVIEVLISIADMIASA